MNTKLYNAAITQLRGKALESLAVIDVILTNPRAIPDHSSLMEELVKHSRELAEYEGAFITLQQYFAPSQPAPHPASQPAPQAPPPQPMPQARATPATPAPSPAEEEMLKRSPTMRKAKKIRNSGKSKSND